MSTFADSYVTALDALWPIILAVVVMLGVASLAFNGCVGGWDLLDRIRLRRRTRATGGTLDELMDGDDWARRNGYGPAVLDEPQFAMPPSLAAHIAEQLAADVDEEWLAIGRATGDAQ